MFKVIGIVLLISVCGIFGLRASALLYLRKYKLREFCFLIGEIEEKMRLGVELEKIYESKKAKKLLKASGYTVTVIEEGISADDKNLMTDFFSKLGMGDLQSGLALCEDYRQILHKKTAEAEKEAEEKSRLYSVLGLCSGIFIAILLI